MGGLVDNKELLMIIKEMFLGYEDRKKNNTLYIAERNIPKLLIKLYYELDEENRNLNDLQANFIQHYIEGECTLENTHEPFEKEGLREMYNYIHSDKIDEEFSIYTLLDLHAKLYSKAPYPESGGHIRNDNVYLPTTGINLSDWRGIWKELKELEWELADIQELGKQVSENRDLIFEYIEKCIDLKCKLTKIHPFFDGNGRSIRGFINKLFLNVGLPSVYISEKENIQYRQAMQKAIGEENDKRSIIQFYYYKICDSIFELDIYPKLDKETFNLPRDIINMAKECTEKLSKEDLSPEMNRKICDSLERQLNEMGINNERRCTTQFNPEAFSHDFILVYYKTVDNKRLIIDPMFAVLESAGKVDEKQTNPILKTIIANLRTSGVASVSNIELDEYVDLFSKYEVSKPKQLAIIKRPK